MLEVSRSLSVNNFTTIAVMIANDNQDHVLIAERLTLLDELPQYKK